MVTLEQYPNVNLTITNKVTFYELIFGQMLDQNYTTNAPPLFSSFSFEILPKMVLYTSNAQIIS